MIPTPSRSATSSSAQPAWLPGALAAVVALILYAVTLGGTYIYDDVILHEDARFTDPHLWGQFWTQDYMPGAVDKLYRPFTCMTLAIEYSLHGDRPWIYHLVNWLLHAATAAAVAELARRVMGFRVAVIAGLLFAVHPVHVEAVAGLVGRAELLCTLAMVGGLVLFLKPMTRVRIVAICACLVVALLSKEQGILLPGILLALVPWRRMHVGSAVRNALPEIHLESSPQRNAQPATHSESERSAQRNVREPTHSESESSAQRNLREPTHSESERSAQRNLREPTHSESERSAQRNLREPAHSGSESSAQRNLQQPTHSESKSSAQRNLQLAAAVCLISAAYLITRQIGLGFDWDRSLLDWTANPLIRSTGSDRLLMPLVLLGRYVILLVAPLRLSLDYGTYVVGWTVNWHEPFVYLGMAALAAWIVLAIGAVPGKKWAAFFCLMSLALSYGMVSNFPILIGTIMGERLMYLPSVFFVILVAALLARMLRPTPVLAGVVAIVVLLASIRTFTYARLWNHPLALYLNDLHDHPRSQHLNGLAVHECIELGKKADAEGRHAEALQKFHLARSLAGDSLRQLRDCWQSYQNVAAADIELHDYADAKQILLGYDHRCPGIRIHRLLTSVKEAEAEGSRQ